MQKQIRFPFEKKEMTNFHLYLWNVSKKQLYIFFYMKLFLRFVYDSRNNGNDEANCFHCKNIYNRLR